MISVYNVGTGLLLLLITMMPSPTYGNSTESHRPVTVADAITMTVLSDQHYFLGGSSEGRVAQFSPDGKWFSIVLERGELEQNTIVYSLLVFETSRAFDKPRPRVLAKFRSSSGRPAIKDPKWLGDNRTLVFLCEVGGRVSQICYLDRVTGRLTRMTRHETPILSFAVSRDGGMLAFVAERPKHTEVAKSNGQGIIVTAETPDTIPRDNCLCRDGPPQEGDDLYIQGRNGQEHEVVVPDFPLRLSPNLDFAGWTLRMY